ncbi:MAG: Hsp33 family molecular chaperone HslO [Proteocatella sp.]
MGKIVRAVSGDYSVRMFAIDSTDMVEEARKLHDTTPVVTAALGRMITAASMMGVMMKGDNDKLTVIIKGDGQIKNITCVVDSKGTVKAYPVNPYVDLPIRETDGKLDVSGAIGKEGKLILIRDLGLKDPYIGQIDLVSGEIAEDLTAYYAYSEQQPSAIALGVLVDTDLSVKSAGGFIIQLMPDATNEQIDKLEANLAKIKSVSHFIDEGHSPEALVEILLDGFDPVINDKIDVKLQCDCSRERMERALISIGIKDLEEILLEDKKTEIQCHFCNKKYNFDENDLTKLIDGLKNN